uniref:Fibronectin type-III domain-containing protein n=1 Tax=Alexandrium monilatum TaxID=311494 RepID=A0A7S4T5U3_9DINO
MVVSDHQGHGQVWEIVGGGAEGGIIVKEGRDLGSPKCADRLSTGALVKELELQSERLHFQRLTGSGPTEGWVSIALGQKQLCVKRDSFHLPAASRALCAFEVLVESLELFPQPVLSLDKRGSQGPRVREGQVLWGFRHEIDGHLWLELTQETMKSVDGVPGPAEGGSLWSPVSVDLNALGIGVTLEVLGLVEERKAPPPESTSGDSTAEEEVLRAGTPSTADEANSPVNCASADPLRTAPTEESTGGGKWGDLATGRGDDEPASAPKASGAGGMFGDIADALDAQEASAGRQVWEVVAGEDLGGIMVREEERATSRRLKERLSKGALVEELEFTEERLHYRLLEGTGPEEGWVARTLGGTEQLVKTDKRPVVRAPPPMEAPASAPEASGGGGMFGGIADALDAQEGSAERREPAVREEERASSRRLKDRLSTGALVQELESTDERLHYRLLEGTGPEEGWVALRLGNRDQLVKTERRPEGAAPPSLEDPAVQDDPKPAASESASPVKDDQAQGGEVQAADPERVPIPLGPSGKYCVENFGWVPPTREELIEMLKDFVAAYSTDEFQQECRSLPPGKEGAAAKQDLLWSLQRPIIGRYGFPQDKGGAGILGECLAVPETRQDPEIAELQQDIFTLLLDPKLQDKLKKEKEAKLSAEAKLRQTPEEIRKRQMEKERKEEQLKELTKKAAVGAETVLGIPVKYKVTSASPLYEGPYFASAVVGQLEVGTFVRGYPGSKTWVKMDVEASRYGETINPELGCWMPLANRQEGNKNVLEAVWCSITLQEASTRSMRVTWPGLETPPEQFQVEYSLDWKATSTDNIGHDGLGLTPNRSVLLTGMPPGSDVSVRVTARVNSPLRDVAGEIVLPGPWFVFQTLPDDGEEDALALGDAPLGEGLYEVTARSVELYPEPSTAKDEAYTLKKGAKIVGIPRKICRQDWLQLTEQTLPPPVNREVGPGDSYWIHLADEPVARIEDRAPAVQNAGDETWRVIHPRVVVREEPSTDAKVLGFRPKGAIIKGTSTVREDGWEWLCCQYRASSSAPLQAGFMLIDGTPIGLPRLMNMAKEVTESDLLSWKASLSRPMPPRPLTASWMAAYGGVPALYSVREELLPASEDVGMNSQCTLVYTAPSGGGSEAGYVAKRATVKDDLATKDTAEQEYRFYAEMVYPPPGESQPPEGQPVMLAGAVRVPRCYCVNFMAAGSRGEEEEEEEQEGGLPKKGRNQYFLLLEMFTKPYWLSMNPANGITMDQAMSAIVSLAKLHLACQTKEVMNKLSWLPLTIFDLEKGEREDDPNSEEEGMIAEFKNMFELNTGVMRQILPDYAFACVERMAHGGVDEVATTLATEPLTFCHGDYRTENLRFGAWGSPPEVGTFDFGLSCRCKAAYDVAYFIVLSQPPHLRKERDYALVWRYLQVVTGGEPPEAQVHEFFHEVKMGILGVLSLTLMTRIAARNAGFYKETRETQTRLLRWVCIAVEDWTAMDAMTAPAAQ